MDTSWLPIGPEVAIDTGALSAARRNAGESILVAARDIVKEAGFEAEDMLIETGNPIQHVAESIAGPARAGA